MDIIDLLLKGWTDLNKYFDEHLAGALDGLYSKIRPADGAGD